ncbi:NAD-dependent epimerase/dehydratase family protein [Streptomyces sp. MAR4 CNY-716]
MSLAVVVGAGSTGVATARLLADAGHRVRLVTRGGGGPEHPSIERVAADASDADRLSEVASGADTLYNCAAPPYHTWTKALPPLSQGLLTAAERTGADYVMLDNLYAYGPVDGPMTEDLPLAPSSVKGRVRAEVWRQADAAHSAGRVRLTTVRASDFIGAGAVSVFTLAVAPKVLAGKPALVPADLDAPHSWTATRDVARALVTVAQDERGRGRVWHAPTPPPLSVRDLAARLARQAEVREPRLRAMPGWMLRAGGLFSPAVRELPEMQYQLQRPFVLDSSAIEETFDLHPTPLEEVLQEMITAG